LGEGEGYLDLRQWPLEDGSMFGEMDVRGASKVAVIGKTIVTQIFNDENPIGKILRIKNVPFKVIGILSPKGLSVSGQDQDDIVLVPFTSAMKRIMGVTTMGSINIQATSLAALAPAQEEIINLLRQRHHITPGHDDDFTVRNQQEIAKAATATSQAMTMLLAAIAGVSLLVGGIGIMNIMLVSVTERTREIGIRLAVGAYGRDILFQFLIEAVTLSMIGGLIGIAIGIGASNLVNARLHWPVLTSLASIGIAFGSSAAVGVSFGFFPAWKASELDPIDALRYE
jgi:putative ABC transport system permease protein